MPFAGDQHNCPLDNGDKLVYDTSVKLRQPRIIQILHFGLQVEGAAMSFPYARKFRALALAIGALVVLPMFSVRGEDVVVRDTIIPTMQGLNCEIPHYVEFPEWLDQMMLTGLSTCLHNNDYSSTCLGSYDGGEDYIIELVMRAAMHVYISLDPKGTGWTGIAIDNSCPPANDCLAKSTSSSGQPQYINDLYLDVGTYYIMVDTWPSPNCIPEFDLQISRIFYDPWGVDCTLPIEFSLTPDDLPLTIANQSTRGSENNFDQTCLGAYDDGEDLFYQFDLPESLRVNVRVDPHGVAGSGFILHDSCPPSMECMAKVMDNLGQEYGVFGVSLPAGTYYLMLDSWSMQATMDNLDIYIESFYRCGDVDGDDFVNISDVVRLINYVFAGGQAPAPLVSGDVNLDEAITISDAVYLINHIFAGGPAPCGG